MIPKERVLEKLDSLLGQNDTAGAKRLLEYWLSEAQRARDGAGNLLMQNELMGLCRKLGEEESAIAYAESALEQVRAMGIEENVGAATTYLNSATVYKAFGMPEKALLWYQRARRIYERELSPTDARLAGLYNNMALALVDGKEFLKAEELYQKALGVLAGLADSEPEQAITYLNMATAAERQRGLAEGEARIRELCEKARACLEVGKERRDGNYAFVCEKCASVFGYYGFEDYALELNERSGRIYEGT